VFGEEKEGSINFPSEAQKKKKKTEHVKKVEYTAGRGRRRREGRGGERYVGGKNRGNSEERDRRQKKKILRG